MASEQAPLLVGLDIGTSGVRTFAFTVSGQIRAEGRATFATIYPGEGQAEQNPSDWWQAAIMALRELSMALGADACYVAGIGLTGQCPTFTCLSPEGEIVSPGLLYQDNRAVVETRQLVQRFGASAIHTRTGQSPSPFYVLPKLLWLKNQGWQLGDGAKVVQPRDLIGWHLTGRLATDPTHAACTLAYDLHTGTWTDDWLREVGLDNLIWPEVLPCHSILGQLTREVAQATGFAAGIPVVIGAADSICASYGAQATGAGVLCEVTGTSTCLHLTVEQPVSTYAVNTYPHVIAGWWYTEVGLNTTGGALAWLATLFETTPERLLQSATTVPAGAEKLLFLPHLSGGERDNPNRQGVFAGLQLNHTSAHMARAVLEGIAYALRQRITLLQEAGCSVTRVVSCGGPSRSALWSQLKADILGLPVRTLRLVDTTAWGAALLVAQVLGIPIEEAQEYTDFLPSTQDGPAYEAGYRDFCALEELFAPSEKKIHDR